MISKVLSCITKQIKQKKKLLFKSLFVLLLGFSFLPQQNYFSFNEAYADTNNEQQVQKDKLVSIDTFLDAFSKVAFVLLWPLVALAGLAMDNSLIYGSFMGLDVTLWNLWQIVRSFANYILGFLFLYCILYWNFSGKTGIKNLQLSDLLKKTLLASVLIQASWFIMMALVDLSTILTYSIGGLPYSIMGEDASGGSGDFRMFKMNVDLNLGNYNAKVENIGDLSSAVIYYWQATTGGQYIAPCDIIQKKFGENDTQSFIIGRKFGSFSGYKMEPGYCMYYGDLFSFKDFLGGETTGYQEKHNELKQFITQKEVEEIQNLANAGLIYPIGSGKVHPVKEPVVYGGSLEIAKSSVDDNKCEVNGKGNYVGIVPSKKGEKGWSCLYKSTDISIGNIVKKSNSMTGPFAALYTSFSVYSHLDVEGLGLWQKFVVTFVNICFAFILVFPLVALVIVLFARIGLLWVVIALSPFFVLIKVFGDIFSLPQDLKKYLSFEQLVQLLLAPVFISFAVGISLVFMSTLKSNVGTGMPDTGMDASQKKEFYEKLNQISGMTVSDESLDMLGFVKIKLDSALLNFSWLLTMFFGLGLTWFLLFFAIKQTAVGKSIGGSLQNLGEGMFLSTPIVPMGDKSLGLGAIMDLPEQYAQGKVRDFERRSEEGLNNVFKLAKNRSQINSFYNENQSFRNAFGLRPNDYSDTSRMLSNMDALVGYSDASWSSRGDAIGLAYTEILGGAQTKEDLKRVVESMNDNRIGGDAAANSKVAKGVYKVKDGQARVIFDEQKGLYEVEDLDSKEKADGKEK